MIMVNDPLSIEHAFIQVQANSEMEKFHKEKIINSTDGLVEENLKTKNHHLPSFGFVINR